jgi:hypothetical protein
MNNIQLNLELTGIVLSIIALVALIAAMKQLSTMRSDSQTQISIAKQQELGTRASILLALDDRFNSEAMQKSRTEMGSLYDEVIREAHVKWIAFDEVEIRKRGLDLYAEKLQTIREEDRPRYVVLLNACSFFETVGYVTKSEYVPLADVLKLFSASITLGGVIFGAHLEKLRDSSLDRSIYENFSWLITEARNVSTAHK